MKDPFEIIIASYPDEDELIAEIWFHDELFAGVAPVEGGHRIELYAKDDRKQWQLDLALLLDAIEQAKRSLHGG